MNKERLKTILIILITLILGLNVGVFAAYALSATDVNYTNLSGSEISVKTALDELYAKVPEYEIGDEVTVGGEQFYVLGWNNSDPVVRLFSKYNLRKDATEQSNVSYKDTAVKFSNSAYWNGVKTYANLNDVRGFESTDAVGIAKMYGHKKGSRSTGLMTSEEFDKLFYMARRDAKVDRMLYGTDSRDGYLNYWLASYGYRCEDSAGSAVEGNKKTNTFYASRTDATKYGVRPIIEVLKSNID